MVIPIQIKAVTNRCENSLPQGLSMTLNSPSPSGSSSHACSRCFLVSALVSPVTYEPRAARAHGGLGKTHTATSITVTRLRKGQLEKRLSGQAWGCMPLIADTGKMSHPPCFQLSGPELYCLILNISIALFLSEFFSRFDVYHNIDCFTFSLSNYFKTIFIFVCLCPCVGFGQLFITATATN